MTLDSRLRFRYFSKVKGVIGMDHNSCQVTCRAIHCSREVITWYNLYNMVNPCVSLCPVVPSNQSLMTVRIGRSSTQSSQVYLSIVIHSLLLLINKLGLFLSYECIRHLYVYFIPSRIE